MVSYQLAHCPDNASVEFGGDYCEEEGKEEDTDVSDCFERETLC